MSTENMVLPTMEHLLKKVTPIEELNEKQKVDPEGKALSEEAQQQEIERINGIAKENRRKLIMMPGSRVRAFDDLKLVPEYTFPEGSNAGTFVRNASTQQTLDLFSPPYTIQKTQQIFEQLRLLDKDIPNTNAQVKENDITVENKSDFYKVLEELNHEIDQLTPEELKSAVEEMHLPELKSKEEPPSYTDKLKAAAERMNIQFVSENPSEDEVLKAILKDSVQNDLKSAYRFKCLSSSTYSDSPAHNARIKDFLQGYNTAYRDNPDPKSIQEKLINKAEDELSSRVITGAMLSSDGTKFSNIESTAKDLISHKAFDRLGAEKALQLIKDSLMNEKFNDISDDDKIKLLTLIASSQLLKNDFSNATKPENQHREPSEILKSLTENEHYKSFTDKTIVDSILLEQVETLPDSSFKQNMKLEIAKHALANAIEKTLNDLNIEGKTPEEQAQATKSAIDELRGNKAYLALGDDYAAEVFVIALNRHGDQDKKAAVEADFLRRFNSGMNKALTDENLTAEQKVQSILNDKYLPYLDQEKARTAMFEQIVGLKGELKGQRQEMLNSLNEKLGTDFEIPKSGFEKFIGKVGDFFKDIPKKVGNFLSSVKNFFNPPPKISEAPLTISEPTSSMSQDTIDRLTEEHKLISIEEAQRFNKEKNQQIEEEKAQSPEIAQPNPIDDPITSDLGRKNGNSEPLVALLQRCIFMHNRLKSPDISDQATNIQRELNAMKNDLENLTSKIQKDIDMHRIPQSQLTGKHGLKTQLEELGQMIEKFEKVFEEKKNAPQEPKQSKSNVPQEEAKLVAPEVEVRQNVGGINK